MPVYSLHLYSWADIGFAPGTTDFQGQNATHTVTDTPDTVFVNDDDTVFQESASGFATDSPDTGSAQALDQSLSLDGTTFFPAGTNIWSQAATTVTNSTTGESGMVYVVSLGDGSFGTQYGFVSTIALEPGDRLCLESG